MPALYVLYEMAAGYGLFEVIGIDELGQSADAVQQSTLDITRFGKVVKLEAFMPFKNAAHALDEINAISEAVLTDDLKSFLEVNLPKVQIISRLYSRAALQDAESSDCTGNPHSLSSPVEQLKDFLCLVS